MHAQISHIDIVFRVNTSHGSDLEFVLRDKEEAKVRDSGFYEGRLFDSLKTQFCEDDDIHVTSQTTYGDLLYTIQVGSVADVPAVQARVNKVISKWVKLYRIDGA